ncbi:unnamed protein product [Dracunculus medinensis]|uniref:C-type lectin domain-containing protein n=1 Tax=Dracunculus medinensis TaxID=318479 RepID=A0A0N4UMK1_DRAME|nr:unnamed protein product [Dracunculus medinensis]
MHNQCRVFESCFRNECKLDFIDCPGGVCAPHHVCVAGRCLRDPLAPAELLIILFEEIQGNFFFQNFGSYNYYGGLQECTNRGGHLASIHSFEEMNFINSLAHGSTYWIGLHKEGNGFRWDDGTPVDYLNYRGREPDNCCPIGAATCTLVNYIGSVGQWDDAGCGVAWKPRHTNIVCKRRLV